MAVTAHSSEATHVEPGKSRGRYLLGRVLIYGALLGWTFNRCFRSIGR